MPISFTVPEDLVGKLTNGALSDEVWVQFVCQTGPGGEHDPDADPDDHVRPSHAAFHGQVFRTNQAPIPPLDYGCRCAIRYVAKPGGDAEHVIEATSPLDQTITPEQATKKWLEENVPSLKALVKVAAESKPQQAIAAVQKAAKAKGVAQPRQIAEMVVDVSKAKPPPIEPANPVAPAPAPTPAPAAAPAAPAKAPKASVPEAGDAPRKPASAPLPPVVPSLAKLPKRKFWDMEAGGAGKGITGDLTTKLAIEMERVAAKVEESVTPAQGAAVRRYTGAHYARICDVDAGKTAEEAELNPRDYAATKADTAKVNQVLNTAPKVTGTMWRGLKNIPESDVLSMINSGEVQFNSMASTSYDAGAAARFTVADTKKGHVGVLFKMEKATGVPIEKMGVSSEHEVLMKKGSKFKVKGAVRTKFIGEDVIVITMEQV